MSDTAAPVERLHVLAGEAEVAISIAVPAPDRLGDPADDAAPHADVRPHDASAVAVPADARRDGGAADAAANAADHDGDEPPEDDDSRFGSYMPMLEELWAIARSDDPDDLRGRPTD